MSKHEPIICPACGDFFECKPGSFSTCRCYDVQLSREQTEYLAEIWDSCLCHKCLLTLKENWDDIVNADQ